MWNPQNTTMSCQAGSRTAQAAVRRVLPLSFLPSSSLPLLVRIDDHNDPRSQFHLTSRTRRPRPQSVRPTRAAPECGAEPLFTQSRERTADWLIIQLENNYSANLNSSERFMLNGLCPPRLKLVRGKDSLVFRPNSNMERTRDELWSEEYSHTTQHQGSSISSEFYIPICSPEMR